MSTKNHSLVVGLAVVGLLAVRCSCLSYKLDVNYTAEAIVSEFIYETTFTIGGNEVNDPTNGFVKYVNASFAKASGMSKITEDGKLYLGVGDITEHGVQSTRIMSKRFFSGFNLFIIDVEHMPTTSSFDGCALWPALWFKGQEPPTWPANGEIDIIEVTNKMKNVQSTLHTAPGCYIPSDANFTGRLLGGDCNQDNAATGCGILAGDVPTGAAFNDQKGGIFAVRWIPNVEITIHFFSRGSIPDDVKAGKPNPESWPIPYANFSLSEGCSKDVFEYQHLIINTDFCGDWAGNTFEQSKCPIDGKFASSNEACVAFVRNNPDFFSSSSYWLINSIAVFDITPDIILPGSPSDDVVVSLTNHRLTFVENISFIDSGPVSSYGNVPAFQLTNNRGIVATAMREGANLVQVTKQGKDFLWDNTGNTTGACYYGQNSNAFPLTRGLKLHGGIRVGAVTAEHGLYFDSQWNSSLESSPDGRSKSIIFSIQDTESQREHIHDPFSTNAYNRGDIDSKGKTMTKYPVTDLIFRFNITLCADEEFVRVRVSVENPTDNDANAEAWMPMTFPIEKESQILSQQKLRWRRDEWCMGDIANIIEYDDHVSLLTPLAWNTSCIFYDFPQMDGTYHAVHQPSTGAGIAFVTESSTAHFTKMWSWGNRANFNRSAEERKVPPLGAGRPQEEYYEPWSSGFNSAFFETVEFKAKTISHWDGAIVPINAGTLTAPFNEMLKQQLEKELARLNPQIGAVVHNLPIDACEA